MWSRPYALPMMEFRLILYAPGKFKMSHRMKVTKIAAFELALNRTVQAKMRSVGTSPDQK